MKEELKDLITKHLPSLAAGEMSKYIEQAEKDKATLQALSQNHKTKVEEFNTLSNKYNILISKEGTINMRSLELDKREEELKSREVNFKIAELTYQLDAEKKSKDSIYQLVNTFVANPRAIEVTSRNRTYTSGSDYHPTGTTRYPISSNEYESKEIKEQK